MTWDVAYEVVNQNGPGPFVFTCDHASNALPDAVPDLGVTAADMLRHIAWDIGAAEITRHLAKTFNAPAILCGTSRLVIDCNRQLHDPALIPGVSDGTAVPANLKLSAAQREQRIRDYFVPYHTACRQIVESKCRQGQRPLFVAVHSMTEIMNGAYRPWQIALSSNDKRDATDVLLAALRLAPELCVGDNQPYDMDPVQDYSTPEHALSRGLPYIQVEFRQDLISTSEGQQHYARIFADALSSVWPMQQLHYRP